MMLDGKSVLALKPCARLEPGRTPCNALSTIIVRGQRAKSLKIRDYPKRIYWHTSSPEDDRLLLFATKIGKEKDRPSHLGAISSLRARGRRAGDAAWLWVWKLCSANRGKISRRSEQEHASDDKAVDSSETDEESHDSWMGCRTTKQTAGRCGHQRVHDQ